ncbi:Tim44 domain-containing protein [Aquipseudomonas alcaligenes]|jgi:predicted lipid-binding transport protein (Tim44 family)|uniref:Tim44 domain-containing protein n=1 Tax=Aquipseudomonas alcaligenes TaxID=43263 RepID=UPI000DF92D70|nr:TIM44-like domain-containing protein [Pseudomonas alcaligenes]MEE1948673.1 TIM44-like domain-containing protein [Pseudomonas alcaligenes]SUD20394.1 membrane protein [Pseudomonas alcaligenes]
MQRFLSIALALCLGLTLSLDASAGKRMGGGKSFGSAPTHQTRQADAPTSAAQPAAAGTAATAAAGRAAPAASGASRWLGPLAGIAAGGLLAAMFMGDGFEGIQFLDILLLGLIAFVIFKLFAARRQAQGQPAMAGGMQRQMPQQAPIFGGASASTSAAATINAPAWFDEQRFIEAGRTHFLALQQHWDAAEMDKIAEFVTPQMLSFLKEERASLGDAYQSTYIDDLSVQLDGIDELADKTVATLTFRGVAKTSRFDQGEPFSESWRMERVNGDNQPWLVAGIRQNG